MPSDLKIFTDIPSFPDDGRQAIFARALPKIAEDMLKEGFEDTQTANTVQGFPACHLNMGWVTDCVDDYIYADFPELPDVKELEELLRAELSHVIRRIKRVKVELQDNGMCFRIYLSAKDDGGYYHYEFAVRAVASLCNVCNRPLPRGVDGWCSAMCEAESKWSESDSQTNRPTAPNQRADRQGSPSAWLSSSPGHDCFPQWHRAC